VNSLTQRVERRLIQQIKRKEAEAGASQQFILCDDYIALANLYRANHMYQKELVVLERFKNLGLALQEDVEKVEGRVREVKALLHRQRQATGSAVGSTAKHTHQPLPDYSARHTEEELAETMPTTKLELTLEAMDDGKASFWHPVAKSTTTDRKSASKPKLPELPVKLVSICAGYTGKTENDEIFELALVAFEYCQNNDRVLRILDEYHGLRAPGKEIPQASRLRFGINAHQLKQGNFDHQHIEQLMAGAKSVISHNDPYIERQLFLCHFPSYARVEWRSSQQDIPWKALGFSSTALSNLAEDFQLHTGTRTPMERAKTIIRLLAQTEPDTDHSLLKRLLSCSPMAPMQWTPTLRAHSKKLNKRGLLKIFG
jgi:hypothetical protein